MRASRQGREGREDPERSRLTAHLPRWAPVAETHAFRIRRNRGGELSFIPAAQLLLPRSAAAWRWSARGLRQGLALEQGGRVDAAGALRAARTQMRSQPADEFRLILPAQFVFPDTNHPPAQPAQLPADQTIPGLVARYLGQPEGRAGPRPGGVLGAAVPEAAVHKHVSLL